MDPKMCNVDLPALMPMLTPIIAAIGVYLALRYQRETMAKATFREFLKLCIQHPAWADGRPADGEQESYSWFVAHFLWAAEEILAYSPRAWKKNLQLHLRYHANYLRSNVQFRRDDLPTYDRRLRRLLRETLGISEGEPPVETPEREGPQL
jgi:hypothetical protein